MEQMTTKVKLKARERLLLANVIGNVKLAITAEDYAEVVRSLNGAYMALQQATIMIGDHPDVKAMKAVGEAKLAEIKKP